MLTVAPQQQNMKNMAIRQVGPEGESLYQQKGSYIIPTREKGRSVTNKHFLPQVRWAVQ